MSLQYQFKDREALAAYLDQLAVGLRKTADFQRTHRRGYEMKAEASGFEQAAVIIRNTEFKED